MNKIGLLFDMDGVIVDNHQYHFLSWQKLAKEHQINITDIAPTLSMLLDVSLPSAATGQPLKELFDYDK